VLATFVMMGMSGLTLNIMSLGGLALGVGLLIDNSIVMLENIFRRREETGEDPEEAAHEGAGEVQGAVIAATATNLAAVIPFLLISGLAALIFRELILTISFAILASLSVALTLVPMLSAQLAKVRFTSGIGRTRFLRGFDAGVGKLRAGYRRVMPGVLRWRWAVLGVAVLALWGAQRLASGTGNEFLPQVDDGGVSVFIGLPPGSTPFETNRIALEVEEMVREMPYVEHVFASAGGMFFGGSSVEMGGRGSLHPPVAHQPQRTMSADAWVQTLQKIRSAASRAHASSCGRRASAACAPRRRAPRWPSRSRATTWPSCSASPTSGGPHSRRPGAGGGAALGGGGQPAADGRAGPRARRVPGAQRRRRGQTLRTALDGTIATRYTEGNREFDVRVRFPRERFTSPEDLGTVALFPGGASGAPIYLRDVAEVRSGLGPTSIQRENQNRIVRVTGDVITQVASVGEVNREIRARLSEMSLPDGYGLIYGGEEEAIRENSRLLLTVTLLAIFLVFVVLAVQYESLVNPLVILMAIPLSLVGVALGLWVTGTPQSAPVLLGVILLAGIVVNNAILLVEYVEQYRRQSGATMYEAAVEAGAVRLRPILMTTLTTMFGMLPLALGMGQGSELMRPLAIAMVGGLSLSMLLTLFVVPSAYVIFNTGADRLRVFVLGPPKREDADGDSDSGGEQPAARRERELVAGD
jgi:multidrug efflux pump subunit AcrB